MFGRRLALLLILTVPIQGFAVPHVHGAAGGPQTEDHGARPHIHLHLGSHHHGHVHAGDSHGHDHTSAPRERENEQQNAPAFPNGTDSHDADALYVSFVLGPNLTPSVQPDFRAGSVLWWLAVIPTGIDARLCVDSITRGAGRGDTPIYLAKLSLRL